MIAIARLDAAIRAAGIPIDGVSGSQAGVRIDFQAAATAQQQTQAQSIVTAFDWSAAAGTTAAAQAAKTSANTVVQSADTLPSASDLQRALVGIVLAIRDEFSNLRQAIPHPIVSITRSGTVATVTTAAAHGLVVGGPIAIAGADVAAYNLTTTIGTAPSATTFTYTVAGTPTTPAAGSLSYTRGVVPQLLDITDAQMRAAIVTKINATA